LKSNTSAAATGSVFFGGIY